MPANTENGKPRWAIKFGQFSHEIFWTPAEFDKIFRGKLWALMKNGMPENRRTPQYAVL